MKHTHSFALNCCIGPDNILHYVNLMTVMLLGGLWHGAQWKFLVWGAIHGGMLAFERRMGKDSFYGRLPNPIRIALTFVIILITWVFFRAREFKTAIDILGSMFTFNTTGEKVLEPDRFQILIFFKKKQKM